MGNCWYQIEKDFQDEVRKAPYYSNANKKDFRKATTIIIKDIRIRNALSEAGLCDDSGRGRPDRL